LVKKVVVKLYIGDMDRYK